MQDLSLTSKDAKVKFEGIQLYNYKLWLERQLNEFYSFEN